MHFSLVKICPGEGSGYGFDDAILPMFHALRRLGFSVEMRINEPNPASRNIVFGSCVSPRRVGRALPGNSIIVNLEQLVPGSMWMNNQYLSHLAAFAVWEYSERNLIVLQDNGIRNVALVPIGYVPEMTRLKPDFPKDIDVLFYGLLNARRAAILDGLRKRRIKAYSAPPGTFGDARDMLVARSKVLLNVHFTTPASLEVVRLGYLWANKKAVVSERDETSEVAPLFEDACLYVGYDDMEEAVSAFLQDTEAQAAQAEKGYARFSSLRLDDELKKMLGSRIFAAGKNGASRKCPPPLESETPLASGPPQAPCTAGLNGAPSCSPRQLPHDPYLPGITQKSWSIQ